MPRLLMTSASGDPARARPRTVLLPDLERLLLEATRDGRRCVVGAVVTNPAGQVLMQRRGPHVPLFPGCWDIVGGHVEPGETVYDALAREVAEETGWRLTAVEQVVRVFDWTGSDQESRREIDVLASVAGDLARPRIEREKFTEARWFDEAGLRALRAGTTGTTGAMIDIALHGLALRAGIVLA